MAMTTPLHTCLPMAIQGLQSVVSVPVLRLPIHSAGISSLWGLANTLLKPNKGLLFQILKQKTMWLFIVLKLPLPAESRVARTFLNPIPAFSPISISLSRIAQGSLKTPCQENKLVFKHWKAHVTDPSQACTDPEKQAGCCVPIYTMGSFPRSRIFHIDPAVWKVIKLSWLLLFQHNTNKYRVVVSKAARSTMRSSARSLRNKFH